MHGVPLVKNISNSCWRDSVLDGLGGTWGGYEGSGEGSRDISINPSRDFCLLGMAERICNAFDSANLRRFYDDACACGWWLFVGRGL